VAYILDHQAVGRLETTGGSTAITVRRLQPLSCASYCLFRDIFAAVSSPSSARTLPAITAPEQDGMIVKPVVYDYCFS